MARPVKNNVDYFPHDAGMRNHPKVKALRTKFGLLGYGVWSMILEYMSGSDGNVFEYSDMELELMSGDFGVSTIEIRNVIEYCISLEMLFLSDGFITSPSLDERLAPVYEKRGRAKTLSAKQLRRLGRFCNNNTDDTVVSVTETPQRKGKESKYIEHGPPSDKYISVKAKYTTEKPQRVYSLREYFKQHDQLLGLETAGWIHFDAFMNDNPAKVFNDDDHLYNTFRNFCESYRAPPPKAGKYEGAEENRRLFTREAWEKQYRVQLATDINFRKHFGYDQLPSSTPVGSNPKG